MNRTLQFTGPAWSGSPRNHRRPAAETERLLAAFEAGTAKKAVDETEVVPDHGIDHPHNPFRPYGSLVGPWREWARLLRSPRAQAGERAAWAVATAVLFGRAPQHLGLARAAHQGLSTC
ncbi:hypothetical protein ACFVT2_18260 [Streptomyces sp. NPDC058000]|uniref:hypothetical protein n=1 Tax=Streptomyces sp. NPDC058000 TaxID=3346299 RepID=UPI0036EBEDA3